MNTQDLTVAVQRLATEIEGACACVEIGNYFLCLYDEKDSRECAAEIGIELLPGELLVDGYFTDFVCDDHVDLFGWDGERLREIN